MNMNDSKKVDLICNFVYDKFLPVIKKSVNDEELEVIMQNIANFFKDRTGFDKLDVEDNYDLLKMVTNGGIVYKENGKTYYEEENEAFMHSILGNMAFKCAKNGVEMGDYDLGNSSTLPTDSEEKVSKSDAEDFIMFLTGNALGYHKKYGNVIESESSLEVIEDILDDEPVLEDITPSLSEQKKKLLEDKKEVVSSFREKLDDLSIDDLKPKTL